MALARAQLSTRLMNVCLAALCRGGSLACAESVLVDAIRLGLPPHGVTYNTLVAAHCRAVGLDAGFAVLRQMREAGVDPDDVTYNSLIAAAARCRGLLMRALDLFDEMLRWDKWRNLSVTAGGYGSREKARMALKKGRRVPKVIAEPMDADTNNLDDVHNTVIDAKPLAMVVEPMQLESSSDKSVARLDDLIFEAINKLKESSGSNKTAIAAYIEEQYWPPDDFQRLLSTKLKALVATGKVIKVNQKYRIAPSSISLDGKSTKVYSTGDMNRENNSVKQLTKLQVDAELDKMKGMTNEEAAAFAAKAVAEAEVAIAEAEEAAKVAEAAEAEAEAAKAFLDAVMLTVQNRNAAPAILRAC